MFFLLTKLAPDPPPLLTNVNNKMVFLLKASLNKLCMSISGFFRALSFLYTGIQTVLIMKYVVKLTCCVPGIVLCAEWPSQGALDISCHLTSETKIIVSLRSSVENTQIRL